jgi:hypothetical protein
MDEDRRIRFLIPPALFIASLLLGAFLDKPTFDNLKSFVGNSDGWTELIKLIAAGGFVVFVAGYVIGTMWTVIISVDEPTQSRLRSGGVLLPGPMAK